ncbi:MAG: TolC family protein, partial [Myxococcota bacterium]
LRAEANIIRWDEAQTMSFAIPGSTAAFPPIEVRQQTTKGLTLSLIQPLTPLWTVYEGYSARDRGVDAATLHREVAGRDVTFQVVEAFFRLLQATRLEAVATQSVEQVEGQVRRARSFEQRGLVARNDVLRADLGLAAVRQRLIQARGGAAIARARLAMVVGLPADTVLEPAAPGDALPPHVVASAEEAERLAVERRGEIREVEARAGQARAGARAAWSRMLPQVSAVATHQRNEGSSFAQEASTSVGGFLSWDVWEWGSTYYGADEAGVRAEQARLALDRVRDGVRLEARAAFVGASVTGEALDVSRRAVAQAEENFRIETRRYEESANTSFDVLDAETLLTQARGQLETATYDYLIADAALRRAVGAPLPGAPGGTP